MSHCVKMKTKAANKESILAAAVMMGIKAQDKGESIELTLAEGRYGYFNFTKEKGSDLFIAEVDSMHKDEGVQFMNAVNICEIQRTADMAGFNMVESSTDIVADIRKNKTVEIEFQRA